MPLTLQRLNLACCQFITTVCLSVCFNSVYAVDPEDSPSSPNHRAPNQDPGRIARIKLVYEPEAGHWARLNQLCWDLTILRARSGTRTSRQSRFVARCTMLFALHHKPPGVQFLNKRFSGFCFKSQIDLDLPSELRGKIQNMALAGQDTSLVNNVGGSECP